MSRHPSGEVVISVRNIGKVYRLYPDNFSRVKESFHPLGKKYHEDYYALNNVSFDVRRGECVGIIGRNGSGKTTLLKIVASVLMPSSGEISVKGRVSALLALGTGFNPMLSGLDNIFFSAAIMGLTTEEIEAKVDSIITFADIGEYIHQPVRSYSSGMGARLGFAVAAHVDPEILIVDEALSVGDIFFQQKCIKHMKEKMAAATKLYVTHDLHSVTTLTERAILLERGNVICDADSQTTVGHYIKLQQRELFGNGGELATNEPTRPPARTNDFSNETGFPEQLWQKIDSEQRSGVGDFVITRACALRKNDMTMAVAVCPNDKILLVMEIYAKRASEELIFGYLFNDRFGKSIFGENTLSAGFGLKQVSSPGVYRIEYEITWPALAPGEYTLTLGIGEGENTNIHEIQNWAHNLLKVEALNPNTGYYVFNNGIDRFETTAIG